MIGDAVQNRYPPIYKLVKERMDEALFLLFREECKFLAKKEVANMMVLYECKNPKNKWVKEMTWKKDGRTQSQLPNCACQGCPIYKP